MALPKDKAWFGARRYGYGWGLPKCWQGCIVVVVYFGLLLAAGFGFGHSNPIGFAGFGLILSAALVGICAWKGEPLKWRWGGD